MALEILPLFRRYMFCHQPRPGTQEVFKIKKFQKCTKINLIFKYAYQIQVKYFSYIYLLYIGIRYDSLNPL